MDLWIRSQDKMELIPIKAKLKIYEGDLVQTSIPNMTERQFNILHSTDFLGEYKNKERALEVLDEIQEKIKNICRFQLVNEDYECDDCVYEMPEE